VSTRVHGDDHLGQVLWTGHDFVVIDFEGERARPAAIRRAKRSPLKDVAGLLRSYHYAAHSGLARWAETGAFADEEAAFVPKGAALDTLLVVSLLEKAVYELAYELNNRPAWVPLPLRGIASVLEEPE
jgi:predicted trehalose synthase